jgi:hypothetical protein
MVGLKHCDPNICDGESISGHLWHCPNCDAHLTSLFLCPECGVRYDMAFRDIARLLRLAVVQQQYNLGNLTEEEARELLSGPLTPGDDTTIVDDSDQLVIGSEIGFI